MVLEQGRVRSVKEQAFSDSSNMALPCMAETLVFLEEEL